MNPDNLIAEPWPYCFICPPVIPTVYTTSNRSHMNAELSCDKPLTYAVYLFLHVVLPGLMQREVRSILSMNFCDCVVACPHKGEPCFMLQLLTLCGPPPTHSTPHQPTSHRCWEHNHRGEPRLPGIPGQASPAFALAQPWVCCSSVFFQTTILTSLTSKATLFFIPQPGQTCRAQKLFQAINSRLKSDILKLNASLP